MGLPIFVQSKYDPDLSRQILEWINDIVEGVNIDTSDGSEDNFHTVLKSGVVLCKLANTMKPGVVKKFQETTLPFKCMDNINSFLKALDELGVNREETFQTVDLWERVNLHSVQICLSSLARKANRFGLKGFGPKEAEENKRNFTEEQLKQGETIINLQYGTNKGANASGIKFGTFNRL
ncbi:calponin-like protein [Euroglyphus maynei]|uniref:Calponin-like protein n=1 Tax=Euroglyphus maynei TaxID=6958 RepID=A0A1Y3B7G7_EURMA|nr:calponin-like protein [Euroglyphus maynei]